MVNTRNTDSTHNRHMSSKSGKMAGEKEEIGDEDHPDNTMMNNDEDGSAEELPPFGDPPEISCHLLIRFLDDAINMLRSLQYVTVGLMSKLDNMQEKFPYQDLFAKLRCHANRYWEWQKAENADTEQAVIDSARSLCLFFTKFSWKHTIGAGNFPVYLPPTGRKFFVGGSCECSGSEAVITKLVEELNGADFDDDVDVVVCVPFVYLTRVVGLITTRIVVAAQDCWRGEGVAVTGEIGADQLVDVGVKWVVTGQRRVLGETSAVVARKCAHAMAGGLSVVIAVGETLLDREQRPTMDVITEQLQALAGKVTNWSKVVLAYEPAKACSPEEAQAVHHAIREWVKKTASEEVSSLVRIVYGAPVSRSTCTAFAKQIDIDGFFSGGAAWNGEEFAAIANAVKVKKNIDFAVEQMMSLGEEPEPPWPEFLEAFVKLRAIAVKRFSTSLFEENRFEAHRADVERKLENAKAEHMETSAQLDAARAQHEVDHKAYLDAQLQLVRESEQSALQAELANKKMLEEFKALEDQTLAKYNAEFSVLSAENTKMEEKLLDMQSLNRTLELQQRGKNGQTVEEVAELMRVIEEDTQQKTKVLAEKTVCHNDNVQIARLPFEANCEKKL